MSLILPILGFLMSAAGEAPDIQKPTRSYYAYVCSESEDEVTLVRFGPDGLDAVKVIPVGIFPAEIEGPHGINVSPGGRYWYVSIAHGQPFGTIHRYRTGTDEWDGDVGVGMFPATLDISATTGLLYVVNSDFYGDHEPSTISVVETSTMTEVAQVPTGTMPHGARLSRDGTFLYSVNMMDDELVELDASRFEISRRLPLPLTATAATRKHRQQHHPEQTSRQATEPSWVSTPTRDGRLYVPALSGNLIFEIDLEEWAIRRRLESTGQGPIGAPDLKGPEGAPDLKGPEGAPDAKGPYNVETNPEATLLVVTYKKGDAVGFWDLDRGRELARVPTTRRIPHGIAITSDGRYTFVTVEGVGGEPGVVEVFDNGSFQRLGTLDVGKQAGGIALWKGRG